MTGSRYGVSDGVEVEPEVSPWLVDALADIDNSGSQDIASTEQLILTGEEPVEELVEEPVLPVEELVEEPVLPEEVVAEPEVSPWLVDALAEAGQESVAIESAETEVSPWLVDALADIDDPSSPSSIYTDYQTAEWRNPEPKQPVEEESSFIDDMGHKINAAALSGIEGILRTGDTLFGDGVDGELIQQFKRNSAWNSEQVSQAQKIADQAEFFSSEEGETFGSAWGDWRAWTGLGASAVGSLIPMAVGGLATAPLKIMAGRAATAGLLSKEAAKKAGTYATTAAMAGISTAMVTGGVGGEVESQIQNMPLELLETSPAYQAAFKRLVGTGESTAEAAKQARAEVGKEVREGAMLSATIPALVLGTWGSAWLNKAMFGSTKQGAIQGLLAKKYGLSAAKSGAIEGAIIEGVSESLQGGSEKLVENVAIRGMGGDITQTRGVWEGVGEGAFKEGIGGGMVGGALGSRNRIEPEIEPENEVRNEADASVAQREADLAERIKRQDAFEGASIPAYPREEHQAEERAADEARYEAELAARERYDTELAARDQKAYVDWSSSSASARERRQAEESISAADAATVEADNLQSHYDNIQARVLEAQKQDEVVLGDSLNQQRVEGREDVIEAREALDIENAEFNAAWSGIQASLDQTLYAEYQSQKASANESNGVLEAASPAPAQELQEYYAWVQSKAEAGAELQEKHEIGTLLQRQKVEQVALTEQTDEFNLVLESLANSDNHSHQAYAQFLSQSLTESGKLNVASIAAMTEQASEVLNGFGNDTGVTYGVVGDSTNFVTAKKAAKTGEQYGLHVEIDGVTQVLIPSKETKSGNGGFVKQPWFKVEADGTQTPLGKTRDEAIATLQAEAILTGVRNPAHLETDQAAVAGAKEAANPTKAPEPKAPEPVAEPEQPRKKEAHEMVLSEWLEERHNVMDERARANKQALEDQLSNLTPEIVDSVWSAAVADPRSKAKESDGKFLTKGKKNNSSRAFKNKNGAVRFILNERLKQVSKPKAITQLHPHADAVKKALREGKTVPQEVLADYPSLAPAPVAADTETEFKPDYTDPDFEDMVDYEQLSENDGVVDESDYLDDTLTDNPDHYDDVGDLLRSTAEASEVSGNSVEDIQAQVTSAFGDGVAKSINEGKVKIVQSVADLPSALQAAGSTRSTDGIGNAVEGLYDSETGTTFLVADQLDAGNIKEVVLHETLHRALNEDTKLRKRLDSAEAGVRSVFDAAEEGKFVGSDAKIYQAAMGRVDDANTPSEQRYEEFMAYTVSVYNETPAKLSGKLRKAVKDIYANIRMALMARGVNIKNLSAADLNAISLRYLKGKRSVGKGKLQGNTQGSAIRLASKSGYIGKDEQEAEEWTQAVNSGLDMSKAARMKRAKAMGFDVDTTYYHGTEAEFDEFKHTSRDNMGLYFTPVRVFADGWGNETRLVKAFLKKGKQLTINDASLTGRLRQAVNTKKGYIKEILNYPVLSYLITDKQKAELNAGGYDSVYEAGNKTVIVFNPNQIRSIDAAFNPDWKDSGKLLASKDKKSIGKGELKPKRGMFLNKKTDPSTLERRMALKGKDAITPVAELSEKMTELYEEALTKAYQDGKITKEELDASLAKRMPASGVYPKVKKYIESVLNEEEKGNYNELINKFKPVAEYEAAPDAATDKEVTQGLGSSKAVEGDELNRKQKKVSKMGEFIDFITEAGEKIVRNVSLRLDIPSYKNNGIWVVTVHDQKRDSKNNPVGGVGEARSYQGAAVLKGGVKFTAEQGEGSAFAIATSGSKKPIAVMEGDYVHMSAEDIKAYADEAIKDNAWTQVGYDPQKHSYWFDRGDHTVPITSATEVIQVGNLILAKDAKRGKQEDFMYSRSKPNKSRERDKKKHGIDGAPARLVKTLEKIGSDSNTLLDKGRKIITNSAYRQEVWDARAFYLTKFRQQTVNKYLSFDTVLKDKKAAMLAHLSHAAGGVIESSLLYGEPVYDRSGAVRMDTTKDSIATILEPLGKNLDVFLAWMAGHRSQRLLDQSAENSAAAAALDQEAVRLKAEISRLKAKKSAKTKDELATNYKEARKLARQRDKVIAASKAAKTRALVTERLFADRDENGDIIEGTASDNIDSLINDPFLFENDTQAERDAKRELFETTQVKFESMHNAIVKIGVETGVISEQDAAIWAEEGFYVPFYRVADEVAQDNKGGGYASVSGLTGSEAYKKLKGSDLNLNDLLTNTMMNWTHIVSAGLQNQAAVQALKTASSPEMGLAKQINSTQFAKTKNPKVKARVDGKEVYYELGTSPEARLVFDSLTSDTPVGMNGFIMAPLRKAKTLLTAGVTASPEFKIANLIRDSIIAMAATGTSTNVFKNMKDGFKATADLQTVADMLAGGGSFGHSGYLHGSDPAAIRNAMARGIKGATILDTRGKLETAWDWYQAGGTRLENVNRAAEFVQQGRGDAPLSLLERNFAARDHLDHSRTGSSEFVRTMVQIMPFLNARMQGLDKLGRAGWGNDPQQRAQFKSVVSKYVMASLALYLHMRDDEEYKAAQQWERDAYHLVRMGDTMARIPRPFELGVIATVVERGAEFILGKQDGGLLTERMLHAITDTLAINPVAQAARPILEVYNNKSWFTGRPIESQSMRGSKVKRKKDSTTQAAIGIANVLDTATGGNAPLSPVEVDYLAQGYFGWMGATVMGGLDILLRPAMGKPNVFQKGTPDWQIQDYMVLGRFARDATPNNSKYITEFYATMKSMDETFADIKTARENGDFKEAQEIRDENPDYRLRKSFSSIRKQLSSLSKEIRRVKNNKMMTDANRTAMIRRLEKRRNAISQRAMDRIE